MANRSLAALIQASGRVPAAGSSFLHSVNGADASGFTSMKEYFLAGWSNWQSSDYHYDPVYHGAVYNTGQEVTFTFDIQAGDRFRHIMRPASEWVIETDGEGYATLHPTSAIFPDTLQGNRVTFAIEGYRYALAGRSNVVVGWNWFTELAPGEVPPERHWIPRDWMIAIGASNSPYPGSSASTINFKITYPEDAGGFNDPLTISFPFDVVDRYYFPPLDAQWYSDHLYTDLVGEGTTHRFTPTEENSEGTFWLKYRFGTTGSFQEYGGISWNDPRSGSSGP